jgi:hypothetical protein
MLRISYCLENRLTGWRGGCQPYAWVALSVPGRFLALISVRGWVNPRAIARLQGLEDLKKKPITWLRIELATFALAHATVVSERQSTISCHFRGWDPKVGNFRSSSSSTVTEKQVLSENKDTETAKMILQCRICGSQGRVLWHFRKNILHLRAARAPFFTLVSCVI